ncbi:MAG: GNAT family N-acetyltransferase [Lachnospiraceae bacterium]|nr:GNAT family N-acetyltransferase [Lachnospiraceae bacterium]
MRDEDVSVREVTDLDELDQVFKAFAHMNFLDRVKDDADRREYAEKLLANGHVVVEYHSERPMGMLCFYCNDLETKIVFISMFALLDELGFAKGRTMFRLAEKSAEIAREAGMEMVRIEVDDKNIIARKLYERMGFEYTEKREHSSLMIITIDKLLGCFKKRS